MEEKHLDLVLVPLGLLLQAAFHTWLFFTVENDPDRTVIGLNKKVRQHWVDTMMKVSQSLFSLQPLCLSLPLVG